MSTTILSDRESLLAAIAARPTDEAPRLVYADWLDEHGEAEEAARIRQTARYECQTAARAAKESREARYAESRRELALTIAAAYHRRIADLYQSKHAGINYGSGGDEVTDWDCYSKKYHRTYGPARYRNAGARVTGYGRSGRIVLESSRGTEVARLPMPPAGAEFGGTGGALVSGDLYCVIRTIAGVQVATRYGVRIDRRTHEGTYHRTGIALRLPKPGASDHYWEHGATVAECRAEHARKVALAEAERQAGRAERKARLVARLCGRLAVTVQDSYAAGNCRQGTEGYVTRFFAGRESATAAELRQTVQTDPSLSSRVESVILAAARRALATAA